MDLNKIIKQAHHMAVKNGFWKKDQCYERLAMLVITDLGKAIDAERHGNHAKLEKYNDARTNIIFGSETEKRKQAFELFIKDTMEDELADACIRLMDMLGMYEKTIIIEGMFTVNADKPLCEFCFYVSEVLILGERSALEKALGMIFAYAKHNNIDIEWHIMEKMAYNEQRPNRMT